MVTGQLQRDTAVTMESKRELVDVAIVGFGPVGQALALMLGSRGYRVHVFERQAALYSLPRAVCIDHEIRRVLGSVGMEEDIAAITHPSPHYRWYNANWELLLDIDWGLDSISGGPDVNFVHQPTLEERLARAARRRPTVTVDLGWDVTHLEERNDRVVIMAGERESGAERHIEARYVVGADGANSFVRKVAGINSHDRGFEADWLVIDVLPNEDTKLDIPPAAQYCNPARPTTIVPAGQRNGRFYRRWEFMRLPGESREALENLDNVWRMLAPWLTPGQAEIVRYKIYTFRSLVADEWRNGRLLLVGDAAHVMPPFMGQGMCAGLRDAANLTWKFDLIFRGIAPDTLLDTYTRERRPHVSDVIDASIHLGKIICVPDPAEAAVRDRAYKDGTAEPPPPFPQLTDGFLLRDEFGRLDLPAGVLSPQPRVMQNGRIARFDQFVAPGFVVIAIGFDPRAVLEADRLAFLERLGARFAHIGAGENALENIDGSYAAFFRAQHCCAVIVRPDFYVYGGAHERADLLTIVDRMRGDLERDYANVPFDAPRSALVEGT